MKPKQLSGRELKRLKIRAQGRMRVAKLRAKVKTGSKSLPTGVSDSKGVHLASRRLANLKGKMGGQEMSTHKEARSKQPPRRKREEDGGILDAAKGKVTRLARANDGRVRWTKFGRAPCSMRPLAYRVPRVSHATKYVAPWLVGALQLPMLNSYAVICALDTLLHVSLPFIQASTRHPASPPAPPLEASTSGRSRVG
jgi:hypothetical protein